jgi:hypothetical protein
MEQVSIATPMIRKAVEAYILYWMDLNIVKMPVFGFFFCYSGFLAVQG